MNNPIKSQIATNRDRFIKERTDAISEMFDNKYADGIYPTSTFFERIDNQHDTSQTSLLQTSIAAVEGMRLEYESEDFNDGGDDEYRDRRIQIQRRVVSTNNQIVSKVVELLKGGIDN